MKTCIRYRLEYSYYYQLGPAHPCMFQVGVPRMQGPNFSSAGPFLRALFMIACNFEGGVNVLPETNSRSAYSLLQQREPPKRNTSVPHTTHCVCRHPRWGLYIARVMLACTDSEIQDAAQFFTQILKKPFLLLRSILPDPGS